MRHEPKHPYYDLLQAAHSAHQEVEDYDLRSEDEDSRTEWNRLLAENLDEQNALIEHILNEYGD